jgi:(S)-2-hydroxy-acid oxidase
MAHRGDALGKDVCCINNLKRLGSERMTPMNRGMHLMKSLHWYSI